MDQDTLILCRGTIASAPFRERVEAASRAGFGGISLFASDYGDALASGLSAADMRALLEANGLEIGELDPLMHWVPGLPDAARGAEDEARFFEIKSALGARSVNVALAAPGEIETDRLVEAFAGVCDRVAEHGLLAHLEFLPWTCVGDLPSAARIVAQAGRTNGGIMFDTWHHARSNRGDACLAEIDCSAIIAIQINDAPARAEDNAVFETLRRRRLPGEGDIPIASQLRRLRAGGCTAPIGVEVFSDALNALPAAEAAERCAQATRAVLAAMDAT